MSMLNALSAQLSHSGLVNSNVEMDVELNVIPAQHSDEVISNVALNVEATVLELSTLTK